MDQSNEGQRLKGKVAIVTGGARGIGAATAKLFAANGAHVLIADILDDLGRDLASTIPGALYVHCDVSSESDVASAVDLAVSWRGRLDIMVNNAGVGGPGGSIAEMNMAQMRALMDVNLCGTVHGIKHAARAMTAGGCGGSIVCVSSTAAAMGGLAGHAYSTSKAAVLGLARSAACELGASGVRVNCVSPHGVPSEMLVGAYRQVLGREDVGAEEVGRMVMEKGSRIKGRGATVEDAAAAVLFLAGDESGFVTGHNLVVDGGYTATRDNSVLSFCK